MKQKSQYLRSRGNSFMYAMQGLHQLFKEEPNARLHAVATVGIVIAGVVRHITPGQWIAIIFAIGLVWITEAINTCIEKLCDFSCNNEIHPAIKIIKDISAGAVLIAAIVSVITGIIVFFF
jgi:diacylglycerol kinase